MRINQQKVDTVLLILKVDGMVAAADGMVVV